MSGFITALTGTNGISESTFWSEITSAVPVIVIFFSVAVGYYLLRKLIKKGSKLKVGI